MDIDANIGGRHQNISSAIFSFIRLNFLYIQQKRPATYFYPKIAKKIISIY
jgi:hypothetical protein